LVVASPRDYGSMKKIGFCKQCLRNVPHVLFFQWPVFRFLNKHLEFADSLPLGSWHCCGCERNSYRLKRPDPEVTTDCTSTTMNDIVAWPDRNDPKQRSGLLFRRKKKADVIQLSAVDATEPESKFEHVGNVTRSDDSLLVRKARAARYSKKFREGVVDRILSGKSTISQVKNELGLSERDLLDWINDRVLLQDRHISKLTQVVDAVKNLTIEASTTESKREGTRPRLYTENDSEEGIARNPKRGKTIDGRVNHG